MFTSLKKLVQKNSMYWGQEVADTYHAPAADGMQRHWDTIIYPILSRHEIDYSTTADFAVGYGRNTDFLMQFSDEITLIDVNQHNLDYCAKKYEGQPNINTVLCNGYNLENLEDEQFSFFYTFDSVVHFPKKIVSSYMPEFFRLTKPHGHCFIHHSNYSSMPLLSFKRKPHWRNYMSAELFADIAHKAGFEVVEQVIQNWGGVPDLDCITVLRKP